MFVVFPVYQRQCRCTRARSPWNVLFSLPNPNPTDQVGEEAQKSVIQRIFQQVAQRPDSFCNYLEGIIPEWGEGTKLIYRHYATLYFVFAVDAQESDLGILDLVQGEIHTRLL